jgi:DNA repair exonuclease SbcCD ATPase subunit
MGMHEKFGELLDDFKLSPKLIPILKEQVRLVLEDSLKSFEGKRKDLLSQITQKENELEKLEHNFAVGHINEKMWKKHKRITQEEIKEIELKLENLPSKKSNLAILDEKILSLLENPVNSGNL